MSKLDSELLSKSIDQILAYAQGKEVDGKKGKVRGFTETIELQVSIYTCMDTSEGIISPVNYDNMLLIEIIKRNRK